MITAEVTPKAALHDLLAVHDHPDGIADIRSAAVALRGGIDKKSISVLDRALDAWNLDAVATDLDKAFALDPFALMAKAWNQIAEVRKAVTASTGPPPAPAFVPLLKHAIDAKLRPRLVLSVQGMDWFDIEFELKLALEIESAELELLGGALAAVKLGKVVGGLTLACQGNQVPAFKRNLKFRAQYRFNPPILALRSD